MNKPEQVKVAVRVKPCQGNSVIEKINDNQLVLKFQNLEKVYSFDHCFEVTACQIALSA